MLLAIWRRLARDERIAASILRHMELKVGDAAPDFTLQASDGNTYALSQFRGRQPVVIAWFPKAFTSGCTTECRSLAQNGHTIRERGAKYFMASVDPVADNSGFAAKESADFPILSDPTKETAKAYGVLNERGTATRWTFYIDKDGRIAHIDKGVKPATAAEDIALKLTELGVTAPS
jgi:thioredoxin-dependent peroxiredoxin